VERTCRSETLCASQIQNSDLDRQALLPYLADTVSGTIAANYFFGKTVANATVNVTAATFHEKPVVIKELNGGPIPPATIPFDFVLPDYFAGLPSEKRTGFLDLT